MKTKIISSLAGKSQELFESNTEVVSEQTTGEQTTAMETTGGNTMEMDNQSITEVHEEILTPDEEKIKKISESSKTNAQKFYVLDGIVKTGLKMYIEMGLALEDINLNDRWKYANHPSWDAYCDRECHCSRTHANRFIISAKIATYLMKQQPEGFPAEHMKPRAESQVRHLGKLKPEYWLQAWCRAVTIANGIPTQRIVKLVVDEMVGTAGISHPKK